MTEPELTRWQQIKAMPKWRDLRWARRYSGISNLEVTPSKPHPTTTQRERQKMKDSTRSKRAKAQR